MRQVARSPMTEEQFMADYTDSETPLERYFLVGEAGYQVVGFWHATNGLMACVIEDDEESEAVKELLRRRGNPSFERLSDVEAHAAKVGWPSRT
jgi:hypothetical protein